MNRLDNEKRAQVVAALVEGNSIRATVRMTGVAKNTIAKLLIELGAVCSEYLNKALVNLPCKRVQCDEIWSFVAAKERNVTEKVRERSPQAGDAWTWVAMDADTKLVCSWMVGRRDWVTAQDFINDLQSRLANRIQLTTDGNRLYLFAINLAFGEEVDYAVLMKLYGGSSSKTAEVRYSPAECVGCEKTHQHQFCGTSKFNHENADAPIHALDECVLKEDREPHRIDCDSLHALQLLPDSPDAARDSSNASRDRRSCLVSR
jgi:IS1 family transposase